MFGKKIGNILEYIGYFLEEYEKNIKKEYRGCSKRITYKGQQVVRRTNPVRLHRVTLSIVVVADVAVVEVACHSRWAVRCERQD